MLESKKYYPNVLTIRCAKPRGWRKACQSWRRLGSNTTFRLQKWPQPNSLLFSFWKNLCTRYLWKWTWLVIIHFQSKRYCCLLSQLAETMGVEKRIVKPKVKYFCTVIGWLELILSEITNQLNWSESAKQAGFGREGTKGNWEHQNCHLCKFFLLCLEIADENLDA